MKMDKWYGISYMCSDSEMWYTLTSHSTDGERTWRIILLHTQYTELEYYTYVFNSENEQPLSVCECVSVCMCIVWVICCEISSTNHSKNIFIHNSYFNSFCRPYQFGAHAARIFIYVFCVRIFVILFMLFEILW